MRAAGYVLTGGKSVRMGTDKALLPYRGVTLVEWIARQVSAAAGSVKLIGAPERYGHLGLKCLGESFNGCGPLSGIEAALADTSDDWNLILACDMPGVEAVHLQRILAIARSTSAQAVLTEAPTGELQPLCGAYHRTLLPAVRKALEHSQHSVCKLLYSMDIVKVLGSFGNLPANVNSPEEWAAWSR